MAIREFDFDKEPTVSVVKKILTDAVKMRATDIHFDPRSNDLLIKFRTNIELEEYTIAPENVKANILTRVKILAGMNITDSTLPQTGAINLEVDGKIRNMSVYTLPTINGEKIVVHISNYATNLKSIDRIGMEQEDIVKIKKLLKEKQGVIIITGSIGSGKTTTTYALLKELVNPETNIISIEDPVKMKIDGVNQVQLSPEKGLNYHTILRNISQLDPNVIAINELIDDETTRTALRLAATGRLVISTLNTKTAYQTIEALLNMNVENYLLGDNIIGIISQRVVKKLCPNCRTKRKVTDYERKIIKKTTGEDVLEIYEPDSCDECKDGYIGLIPVSEVVPITPELRDAINNNRNHSLIRKIIYGDNDTILKDGFKKVIRGETSFSEIIEMLDLKTDFSEDDEELKNLILGKDTEEVEVTEETKKEVENNKILEKEPIINTTPEINNLKVTSDTPTEPETVPVTTTPETEPVTNVPVTEPITEPVTEPPKPTEDLISKLASEDEDEDGFNYDDSYQIV